MNDPEIEVESSVAGGKGGGRYAVLRNRDFILYLVGRFFASIGQQMLIFSVGWELYERTHAPLALGFVGLAFMIPMVALTLPAGHVADSFNRKRIIISMATVLSFASLGLAVISWLQAPVMWVYACLFVIAGARTFLWPASAAFLPHIVTPRLFPQAVAFNSGIFQLSSVAGPAIAGILLTWLAKRTETPAAIIYLINSAAGLFCVLLLSLIRREHAVVKREPISFRNLGAGFRFVFENKIILGTLTLDLFAVFLGGATAMLPIYAKDILSTTPSGLAALRMAMPIGAVICTLIIAYRPPLQKAGRAMLWSVAVFGVATIVFGVAHVLWLSFGALVVCGAVDNISVIVRQTLVQVLTPDEKRGRVSAVNSLFIGTSNELGEFRAGMVAHFLGPVVGNSIATGTIIAVVTGGVGTILAVIAVAWIWPELRRYGRLDSKA
ncbi:MAG TPA: MFS transporter [Verrucomicrobiae bacterium]|nr:MFS transporter [Verrucomicrobiae bacterium]